MSNFDTSMSVGELIQQQAAEMLEDLQEAWQDKAVQEFPAVKDLKQFLRGNTKEEILDQAKNLSEKLGTRQPAKSSPAVTGGSPALPDYQGDDDELAMLRQNVKRNPSNQNWSAYLQKKHELAGVEYPGPVR